LNFEPPRLVRLGRMDLEADDEYHLRVDSWELDGVDRVEGAQNVQLAIGRLIGEVSQQRQLCVHGLTCLMSVVCPGMCPRGPTTDPTLPPASQEGKRKPLGKFATYRGAAGYRGP
jgi:hypothetical protein